MNKYRRLLALKSEHHRLRFPYGVLRARSRYLYTGVLTGERKILGKKKFYFQENLLAAQCNGIQITWRSSV